ncbi:MAG: prephenate dehydrogenase [Gemmatimonadota bacterium]
MAVVGLGLMGGSLLRTLAELPDRPALLGVDPDPVRGAQSLEGGFLDRYAPPGSALPYEAELVVLACPLGAATRFLREEGSSLPASTLVTDVVSLNAPILTGARSAGIVDRTVTAHPMCGSERSGLPAQRADLYRGERVWLSASSEATPAVRRRIEGFWRAVGSDPRWIDPEDHDRSMAWVSHLPQLVANALAGALDAQGFQPADLGPGGRDMTRLARSSPVIWKELLEHSAPVTGTGLTSISRALNAVADLLARRETDRIVEFMELTRRWAAGEATPGDGEAGNADEHDPEKGGRVPGLRDRSEER